MTRRTSGRHATRLSRAFAAARPRPGRVRAAVLAAGVGLAVAVAATSAVAQPAAPAAEAPPAVRVVAATEKVCQLTGELDWETGRPTAARTRSSFGLDAADLGYPVEHRGKLLLLYGDSCPPGHGGGAAGELPPDDAVGVSARREPPRAQDGRCLDLAVHHAGKRYAPARVAGPRPVKQGFFHVPSGGVTVGGSLYAFFWTDHCSDPAPLPPVAADPLARPPVRPAHDCPETDDRNSVGTSLLARSEDEGFTFTGVAAMPAGFVYATAVNARLEPELPEEQRLGVFVFAVPRYRASVPYLALAPADTIGEPATWRFFTGLDAAGRPTWVTHAEWERGRSEGRGARAAAWNPPGAPELFTPRLERGRSVGELSVTWNRELRMWLMVYGGPGGILARVARAPWGPWSEPTHLLGGEAWLPCRLLMAPEGCGTRRDFWPGKRRDGAFVPGGLYAPYVLERYTSVEPARPGEGPGVTVYWLVSTWNPYEVTVMRTTLRAGPPAPPGPPR